MGTVNKIVNVVVVLLAVACVVLGTLLFKKREQLRFRGDKMAAVINNVSKWMDKESETEYSKKILVDKLELDEKKDPKASENKAKTLHLTNYDSLETVLKPFEKQTTDLMKQRDELADALNSVSETLKMPDTYGAVVFKSVKTYGDKKKNLLDTVAKVSTRDEAIVDQIVSSSKTLGFTVDPTALKDLENFRPALNEFGGKIDNFKKRLDDYASHISKICGIMEITSPSLSGEDYASELSSAEGRMNDKKAEHEKTKRELLATQDELKQTTDKLNNELANKAELEKQVASLNENIKQYKMILSGDFDVDKGPPTEEDLIRKLTGKVIEVNDKWNFVIIDLGNNNKVPTKSIKKDLFVSVPVGRTMMVSRRDEPIAEIKIVRVIESCSVADVIPNKKWSAIQPGDVVKFSDNN
jgi:hypothetical protein